MTLLADHDVTEEWKGAEEIIQKSLVIMYKIRSHYDLCTDSSGPKAVMLPGPIKEAYLDLKRRGIKIRCITEITNDNLAETKQFMQIADVRHLEGIRGNFVIADSTDYAGAPETKDGMLLKLMVSNVSAFVEQQQYFFETLWEKAIPADQRIAEIENGIELERTEIIYGMEKIVKSTFEAASKTKRIIDNCIDKSGPSSFFNVKEVWNLLIDLQKRRINLRFITEITPDNIRYCKELAKIVELKHLDQVLGNFGIHDGTTYRASASVLEGLPPEVLVTSTARPIVEQQQYFFEMLWNKAIPAEQRIKQIEVGIDPEITEVLTGWESIIKRNIENLSSEKHRIDTCFDAQVPRIIVQSPMYKASSEFVNRGGKIRVITEITAENLSSIRELMKFQEIRHIDSFKINFGVSENIFTAPTSVYSTSTNPQCIYSNSKDLIREHQYLFETFWEKAIPASEKIRQIEQGIEPQKIELIQDTRKSISLAFEVMKRTKEELLILFATPRTFILGYSLGSIDNFDQMSKRGVNVRLLVPKGSEIENEVAKIKELNPSIIVRISDVDLSTNITILVADRKEFISWELKDDTLSDPYEAGGIATYSNIRSLATSYGTIFDNLWKITEFAENLKAANVKLEKSEKSMKDFIDVAAHELRTPIQPIIGLTEVLRDKTNDPAQAELFDAIIRNAERLQRLQEDILDVTKIESQLIRFDKQAFHIDEVINHALKDIKGSPTDSGNVKVLVDLQATSTVRGDRQRIIQVILNLVGNSMKFTRNGTISVRSRRLDGKVIISVTDTGTGIDPEIMPRLFTKFAAKSPSGTGLGLFISKSIIEAHGGKIWAENNADGLGATFSFSLPQANN